MSWAWVQLLKFVVCAVIVHRFAIHDYKEVTMIVETWEQCFMWRMKVVDGGNVFLVVEGGVEDKMV
jgi:hypothetical protein